MRIASPEISETSSRSRPKVILDVKFEDGVLSMVISNIGTSTATNVSIHLDKKIQGLGGAKEINSLNILSGVTFLPPQKSITFLVDSASAYFARKEPTKFTADITYSDDIGKSYEEKIAHNLDIYKDLPYRIDDRGTLKGSV